MKYSWSDLNDEIMEHYFLNKSVLTGIIINLLIFKKLKISKPDLKAVLFCMEFLSSEYAPSNMICFNFYCEIAFHCNKQIYLNLNLLLY